MSKKELLPQTAVPDIQDTVPEVFIMESLSQNDERIRRYEGLILCDMLRLAGKNPKYVYFQSEEELPHVVGLFRQSRYRYLHISSHASSDSIGLTNGSVDYRSFADYFDGHLKLRRLFFSACQVGNQSFVEAIASNNKGIHSIAAPVQEIDFDHAAAAWSALYISLFAASENSMKSGAIKERLIALRMLFPVDFFFAAYKSKTDKWNYDTINRKSIPTTSYNS